MQFNIQLGTLKKIRNMTGCHDCIQTIITFVSSNTFRLVPGSFLPLKVHVILRMLYFSGDFSLAQANTNQGKMFVITKIFLNSIELQALLINAKLLFKNKIYEKFFLHRITSINVLCVSADESEPYQKKYIQHNPKQDFGNIPNNLLTTSKMCRKNSWQ